VEEELLLTMLVVPVPVVLEHLLDLLVEVHLLNLIFLYR
jgi:hypothetical protein